jgi:hypothetical protein
MPSTITISSLDGTGEAYALVDGISRLLLGSDITHNGNVEAFVATRAESVEFFDRGGESSPIALRLIATFDTPEECLAYCLQLRDNVPMVGNVEMELEFGGGLVRSIIAGAMLRPISCKQVGVSAIVNITITAPSITTS